MHTHRMGRFSLDGGEIIGSLWTMTIYDRELCSSVALTSLCVVGERSYVALRGRLANHKMPLPPTESLEQHHRCKET
jgi:hypothetical protein